MASPNALPVVRDLQMNFQTLVTKLGLNQLVENISLKDIPGVSSISSSKNDQTTDDDLSNSARWNKNTATVYLEASNRSFRNAYLEALKNWNRTGAFNFDLTDDKNKAQIILKQQRDPNTSAAGVTNTTINQLTGRLITADVYLNSYYLLDLRYGYSQKRITNTAEHELGHAIGLAHDDDKVSVMRSAGSYYSIQQSDIDAVKTLYGV